MRFRVPRATWLFFIGGARMDASALALLCVFVALLVSSAVCFGVARPFCVYACVRVCVCVCYAMVVTFPMFVDMRESGMWIFAAQIRLAMCRNLTVRNLSISISLEACFEVWNR